MHSCRHLKQISIETDHDFPDGVYKIYPKGQNKPILTYCDMSRDGGGWTLLVTSHTNTWTADNVRLRNQDNPRLDGDYSILSHADTIKNNINIKGLTFEYRLEAQGRGRKSLTEHVSLNLPGLTFLGGRGGAGVTYPIKTKVGSNGPLKGFSSLRIEALKQSK